MALLKRAMTFAAGAAFAVTATTADAAGLIRDAEIENTLREWTDPILEVAGFRVGGW